MKEIRDFDKTFVAIATMTMVTAWLLCLSIGLAVIGASAPQKEVSEQFSSMGGLQIAFTCLAVLLCLPSVVKLALRCDTKRIALWQVIGASPRRAKLRYFYISIISAAIGSSLGVCIGWITWPLFGLFVERSGLLLLPGLSKPVPSVCCVISFVVSLLTISFSVLLGIRKLSSIEPVQALLSERDEPDGHKRLRRLVSSLLVCGVFIGYLAISLTPRMNDMEQIGGLLSSYWGAGLGLLIAYGISDKLIVGRVVNLVGRNVFVDQVDSWFLAQTSAKRRATLSTSVITPVVISACSVGCIFGMVDQIRNVLKVLGVDESNLQVSPTSQIVLVFGAPVLIAAFSGLVSVYLTNDLRKHDIALLQSLGATAKTVRLSAIFECTIYFVAAGFISTLLLGVNALAMGIALGQGPIPGASPAWFGWETYSLLALGFGLVAGSIIIPTVRESKSIKMVYIFE